jgi:2',3'-cyclic-nucleotide 2'-phosphodiesterase (5'-nucleotidase family)
MIEPLNRRVFLAGLAATGSTVGSPAFAAGPPTFTLVLTNDIYKMNEDGGHGGIPRLAAVVKAERAKSPNVIFTHAGDTLSPSLMSGFDQGEHMISLFNEIALDVFAPGNHEFDFGRDVYLKRMAEAKFPILAANLRDGDGSMLPNHRDGMIIERGGLKIGIAGAALEYTPMMSSPGNLRFGPEIEAIVATCRSLKSQGADLTIALVHADKEIGQRLMASRAADIIISGHNHDLHVDYDGRCALVESGEDANFAVAIDIATVVRGEGAARTVAWAPTFRIHDTADVTPDPETLDKVKAFEADLSKELDVDVATIAEPLDSRTATVRGGEAAIGNFIADALRLQNNAEIAIINGGGIRANKQYKPGDKLTRRDILAELPFGNKSVVTRVTGKAVWASLENGVSQVEQRAGRFPQISGIKATVDYNAPPGARITAIEVDGKPIDETRVYTVATNDFMVRGGDGYTALANPNATSDTGDKLLANDVMVYARKLGTVNAKIEGRMTGK